MSERDMFIAADGHLHWYPCYRLDAAYEAAVANLDAVTRKMNPLNLPSLNLGLLVEGERCNFFDQLKSGRIDTSALGVEIQLRENGRSLMFMQAGICRLCLVAGRQIATSERVEILGIGMSRAPDAGLTACEAIGYVVEHGGFPILPWSPGKWLFKRGALVKEIIEQAGVSGLAIGDCSLRPRCFGEPGLMRRAREKGLALVPGSDPLPLRGEERAMGSFGFGYEGPFDPDKPAASAIRVLAGDPARISPAGYRNSLLRAIRRLVRLRIGKTESASYALTGGA